MYFYRKQGLILTFGLGLYYVTAVGFFYLPDIEPLVNALIRTLSYILIGYIIYYLAEKIDSEDQIFKKTFENSKSGLALLSSDLRIQMMNSEFRKISGYYDYKENNSMITDFFKDNELTLINTCLIEKSGENNFCNQEVRINTKNGMKKPVFVSFAEIEKKNLTLMSIVDISERVEAEEKILRTTHELSKRIKELTCLKEISDLMVENPEEDDFFKNTAQILKRAMQYPESAIISIKRDGKEYNTDKFYKSDMMMEKNIYSGENKIGIITVCYLKNSTGEYPGEFLKEEIDLLEIICERIGSYLSKKYAENSLRISEAKLRELFNNMSSGVAIYEVIKGGNDFIFKDYNKASETLDGIKREDVIGKSIYEIFPGVKDFGLPEILKKVWLTGKPEYFPLAEYVDDRLQVWRENYVYRLPTGEIAAIYNDLTEKKIYENALKESEYKYHELFDNINEAVFLLEVKENNVRGHFIEVNDVACHSLGYTREELLNLTVSDIDAGTERTDDPAKIELLKDGEQISFFSTHIRKDQTLFPVSVKARIIKIGGHNYILSLVRDITEEEQSRLRENAALRQIEENLTKLAVLNDQIRNPLSVIVGIADLSNNEFKDEILEQAGIINDMITDLDRGWNESSKIRDFLKKHYEIDLNQE